MSTRKRVLILCPSPKGTAAAQRLKYEQYLHLFEKEGYDFTISSFQSNHFWKIIHKPGNTLAKVFWVIFGYAKRLYDLLRAPFYDLVFVTIYVTPLGAPVYEHLLFLFNKNVVYDLDDMMFMPDVSGSWFKNKIKGKNKPIVLMQKSKYVIVCTPKLEEIALDLNKYKNVVDISSTFNTERFVPVKSYAKNEVTTIGWTGTHSTIPYLELLTNVLQQVSKLRKIKLLVIANKEFSMPGVNTEFRNWSAETEVSDLQDMEIGVYPIPENEWSLGKSSLKALTYMSIGIPAVATAYGTNFRIIENGISGILVSTDEEWINKLVELIDDVNLRRKIGEKGRERVENLFSVKANFPKYLKAFETTLKKN
jgi:L-malate glycosyltransferase